MDQLPFSEVTIRIAVFVAIFGSMAALEIALPRRTPDPRKVARWRTNLLMVVVDSIALRVVFPLAAVGWALWAEANGTGLFRATGMPIWLAGLIGFIVLDFAVWLEHVASHKIPILWRIHRMHHSDIDFDVTTALRFHPLEIILSMMWKAAIVVALGVPVIAVLLFEIVLNGAAMFNHSNWKIPERIDAILRLFIVTPDMHRVHHSVHVRETDSNYGFNFPFWDRLFRTYTDQPRDGHVGMTIGLNEYRGDEPTGFVWSLILPFRSNRPRVDRLADADSASLRTD
ncbi:MAG TPA: sterol desaturase family protein [Afifellaceae bacterium]|nr:sterol desaturase family protein [Afifellaceae bacterium]